MSVRKTWLYKGGILFEEYNKEDRKVYYTWHHINKIKRPDILIEDNFSNCLRNANLILNEIYGDEYVDIRPNIPNEVTIKFDTYRQWKNGAWEYDPSYLRHLYKGEK